MKETKGKFTIVGAAVFKGEISSVEGVREELKRIPGIELIFFTTSGGKLFIVPENKRGGRR